MKRSVLLVVLGVAGLAACSDGKGQIKKGNDGGQDAGGSTASGGGAGRSPDGTGGATAGSGGSGPGPGAAGGPASVGGSSTGGASGPGGATATPAGGAGRGGSGDSGASGGRGTGGTGGGAGGTTGGGTGGVGTGGARTGGAGGGVGTGGSATGGVGSGGSATGGSGTGGSATGGSGTGGSGGAGGSGVASLQQVMNAFCATARTCCARQGFSTAMLSACEAQALGRQPAIASVQQGTVTLNNTALAACLAAYQSAATTCVRNQVVPACQDVFVGTKTENQPCANVFECRRDQGPATCLRVYSGNVTPELGVCKRIQHGASGQICFTSCQNGETCSTETTSEANDVLLDYCFEQDGLYCPFGADTPRCMPVVAEGGVCGSEPWACGSNRYCDTTCRARLPLGGVCQFGWQCAKGLFCVDHLCVEDAFASEGVCMGDPLGP